MCITDSDRAVSIYPDKRQSATELADQIAGLGDEQQRAPVVATRTVRWQPWAIVGALVLVLVLALRGHSPKPAPAAEPPHHATAPEELPDHIELRYPPNMSEKAAHDWERVARPIYDNDFK